MSPPEVAWRIYAFPLAEMKPFVIHLQVHLENFQYLNFYGNEKVANIIEANKDSPTMLTQFFQMNCVNQVAKNFNLHYVEFPEYFVWSNTNKVWTWKKKKKLLVDLLVLIQVKENDIICGCYF